MENSKLGQMLACGICILQCRGALLYNGVGKLAKCVICIVASAHLFAALAVFSATTAFAALPSGYTQYTCIRGWGGDGQIVINDYTPTPNYDKIEAVVSFPSGTLNNKNHTIWCARGDSATKNTWTLFVIGTSDNKFRLDYGSTAGTPVSPAPSDTDVKYTVTADGPAFTWSGGDGQTHTGIADFTAGGPLSLFASYLGGVNSTVGNYGRHRLYSFKIWRSGTLIHDLVPASRSSDLKIGLYDVAADKFYAARTGTFSVGDTMSDIVVDNPNAQYTYIQGNGTNSRIVIDDYTPTPNNDKIEAVLEFPTSSTLPNMCVWCARGSKPTDATWSLFVFNSMFRFDYNNSAGELADNALAANTQYTITADGPTLTWSGGAGITQTYSNDFTSAGGPLALFAAYSDGIDSNKGYYANCKLYSFKIWRSGELIHDLVPATRLIESRVRAGLYDVKKDKFYAGTGTFMIGDAVKKRGFTLIVR